MFAQGPLSGSALGTNDDAGMTTNVRSDVPRNLSFRRQKQTVKNRHGTRHAEKCRKSELETAVKPDAVRLGRVSLFKGYLSRFQETRPKAVREEHSRQMRQQAENPCGGCGPAVSKLVREQRWERRLWGQWGQ